MKFYHNNHMKSGESRRPVTLIQAKPVDRNRVKELQELIYQVFVGVAPQGRSLPNVVTDAHNGTINFDYICSDDRRYSDACLYLKMAWLDQRKLVQYEITDTKIVPIYKTETTSLDEALMSVYGYNPYLA